MSGHLGVPPGRRYGLVPYEQFGNRTLILWAGWVPVPVHQPAGKQDPQQGENSSSSDKVKVYSTLTFVRGTVDVRAF